MYAIVKTGGKQYRVEQGTSLLVERLRAEEGAKVTLDPLLLVDGEKMHDSGVKVEAKVIGHERGPKLRVVKFKPKRGYKRRTGHRQELTRLEVTAIKGPAARKPRASTAAKEEAAPAEKPEAAPKKPAPRRRTTTAKRPATPKKKETATDGS
jgi:large subunit ribosomal protein L21